MSASVVAGCRGCEDTDETPVEVDLGPVPAPQGLIADLVVNTPDATFKRLRERIGGTLGLLPSSYPALVVTMLGLPPQAIEQLEANSPSYGAMIDGTDRARGVMAVRVRDSALLLQILTSGPDARFDKSPHTSGLTLLSPRPTQTTRAASLAMCNGYLLVGERVEDLVAAGPYVSRTLPKHQPEQGDIVLTAPASALKGPIVKRIRDGWQQFKAEREREDARLRAEHRGKAPDFGEPSAALADLGGKVERITALLADLNQAQVRVHVDDDGVHARALMDPGGEVSRAEFASLITGNTEPLFALPANAVLGMLMRDSATAREQSATDQAESVRELLGKRLANADAAKVQSALQSWARGRGDWLTAGLMMGDEDTGLLVQGALADEKSMQEALRAALGLASVPAIKEPIEHHFGKLTWAKPQTRGDVTSAHVKRTYKVKDQSKTHEFDLAWRTDAQGSRFALALAEPAKSWMAPDFKPATTLSDNKALASLLRGLGDDVAFALFVEPKRMVASIAFKKGMVKAPAAPIVLSYGGAKAQGWYRLDLSYEAAREVLRMLTRR